MDSEQMNDQEKVYTQKQMDAVISTYNRFLSELANKLYQAWQKERTIELEYTEREVRNKINSILQ